MIDSHLGDPDPSVNNSSDPLNKGYYYMDIFNTVVDHESQTPYNRNYYQGYDLDTMNLTIQGDGGMSMTMDLNGTIMYK